MNIIPTKCIIEINGQSYEMIKSETIGFDISADQSATDFTKGIFPLEISGRLEIHPEFDRCRSSVK